MVYSETVRCMGAHVVQEMEVDSSHNDILHASFNITFPSLPCRAFRLHTADNSGNFETESIMEMIHDGEIHKWQLDAKGRRLTRQEYIRPRDSDNPFIIQLNYDDLAAIRKELQEHNGCNVNGWMQLKKVGGDIVFSVSQEAIFAAEGDVTTIEALLARHASMGGNVEHPDAMSMNISHIIHTFRFGDSYPTAQYPLESMSRIDRKATGIDTYFVQVVPTTYTSLWGRSRFGDQYSVTEYYTRLPPNSNTLPGIVFRYDTWPIRVHMRVSRLGFAHLLMRLCAVCGGLWTVTGLVDSGVHTLVKTFSPGVSRKTSPF